MYFINLPGKKYFVKPNYLDSLRHTVRNSLEVKSQKQGVGQEQRKTEHRASSIARQASEINQARIIDRARRVISSPD